MTIVREFSAAGPCLTLGRLVRTTAQFYVYNEWKGGDRYDAAERKVRIRTPARYSGAHIVPCHGCRDHANTQYPNGYDD